MRNAGLVGIVFGLIGLTSCVVNITVCVDGEYRCDLDEVLEVCIDGAWELDTDCAAIGAMCHAEMGHCMVDDTGMDMDDTGMSM